MKRLVISITIALVLIVGSVSTALAAKPEKFPDGGKPQEVIERSNGFTSGQHFNLNLHGRGYDWDGTSMQAGNRYLFV